ncbi:hypothetical protein FNF31_07659 [Cafeteria roenbergensis]|uniref:Uncharacterized protein n=1 Tax=Cafeteria roenbergensis TaxID=33653 RepID=A0A5A8C1N7_CAFRO|nr:hypothetical protein FNF31_07659 [Cafeteria roenbergensis]
MFLPPVEPLRRPDEKHARRVPSSSPLPHSWVAVSAGTRPPTPADLGTGCGGNCPGGCSKCPCGESSHYVSIATA